MIPKLSDPLKAGIRTSEFWLTTTVGALVAVYSAIKPDRLPPEAAAIIIGAKAAVYTVSRNITKGLANFNGVFGIEDAEPAIDMPTEVSRPASAMRPDGYTPAAPPAEAAQEV